MSNCNYVYTKTSGEWLQIIKDLESSIDDLTIGTQYRVKTVESEDDKIEYFNLIDTVKTLQQRLEYAKEQYLLALEYENKTNNFCGITLFKRECGY